ncbi:hypothetical protein CONLIGDRAFT_686640 [Coniochaeta ligniaria NRRL 30616]|uniref:Uncharacterized protein n=1 Tax=Coniochaeta ligniaria NRRL 30616 TaxID=1408157 RepID=A0A1J7J1J7_9PEZI|nr:hypothetical protein CONLIGDRAFT_686640 [Coniochaeta ligniaria NRRL 30616]
MESQCRTYAALLPTATAGAPSLRVKRLLVRLAFLSVYFKRLADSSTRSLTRMGVEDAADLLNVINHTRDGALLANANPVWPYLGYSHRIRPDERGPPLKRANYASIEEEIDSLGEPCTILAHQDMPCVWKILRWAYRDKTFSLRRHGDGTYSARHLNTMSELELGDRKD